ncbi:FecR domain-containing protein [Sphingomonas sp. BT-65]|uniref:FecR family protein n=1 Tax=Sphingomonas sp. BT-65 TaxID=2989821 RepID=UPI002235B7B8|nr:FecR domain-containing protein [Sphingomonas sp. BT-65]MCW4461097.1 FecR domain-containing protein [Sphingomonas sp. BT-65]
MTERESSRYIDATAADWIARLDRGPLSQEEAQALEAWLDGDPRRRGALLRADALSLLSESAGALGSQFDPAHFAPPAPPPSVPTVSRRKLLAWTGAGGLAAASIGVLAIGIQPAAAITTGLGEVRLVTLDDGSTVMLNTQSSMRVRYGDRVRRVELLYGEAYFTVVPDQRRPFVVDLPGQPLRAARGTFRVRKLEGKPVDILVDQGGVSLGAAGTADAVFLRPNMRLTLPEAASAPLPAPETLSADHVSRALAWREGKIAFEGERLDEAAAEFARYSKTRIEIRDPALASEPVTGLFAASDPAGFGRAVASVFDARVEQQGDAVILTR